MIENALAPKTAGIVRSAFRGYYFRPGMVETPEKIDQREFAYMQFGQSGMMRHLSFMNMKELIAMIMKDVPSDIYCSNTCTTAFRLTRCRKRSGSELT